MFKTPDLSPETLKAFFLAGAAATYASGKPPKRPDDRLWVKFMEWSDEERFPGLYFRDEWDSSGDESAGKTVIVAKDDRAHPVWSMAYGGACKGDDKEVLAFHKRALLKNYADSVFEGGRGPSAGYLGIVGTKALYYRSSFMGDFAEFDGGENVIDATHIGARRQAWYATPDPFETCQAAQHDGVLFWHWFHGGLMGRAKS